MLMAGSISADVKSRASEREKSALIFKVCQFTVFHKALKQVNYLALIT